MAYVYRHIREDKNLPFYIGIGSDKGLYRSVDISRRSKHWNNIVNKTKWHVEIIFDDISYEEAKIKEIEFIELYKRTIDGGILVNKTKGGEGTLGLTPVNAKKCYAISILPNEEIKEFNSMAAASMLIGGIKSIRNIKKNILGEIRMIKGWRFSLTKEQLLEPLRNTLTGKHNNHKTVIIYGLHLETNETKTFNSLKEAALFIGIKSYVNISYALSDRQKYCKKWVFAYDIEKLSQKASNAKISIIEHRKKISISANNSRINKKIQINNITYQSISEASMQLNITYDKIYSQLNSGSKNTLNVKYI